MARLYSNENFPLPVVEILGKPHTGIIACTLDKDFTGLAQRIHDAIEAQGELTGRLIRINRLAQ